MNRQDLYWNFFIQSGDPEAYMLYKRQDSPIRPHTPGHGRHEQNGGPNRPA